MNVTHAYAHLDERKKEWYLLGLVIILSLVVKLISYQGMQVQQPVFRADAKQYVQTAFNIQQHGVFADKIEGGKLTINRLPGYPLLLAVVAAISGDIANFYHNALLTNLLLGLLSVVLIFRIARYRFNRGIAATIALLTAINPHILTMEGYILTETLFCFEVLLLLWLGCKAQEKNNFLSWLGVGAVIGYTLLTRPSFLLFLPFLATLYFVSTNFRHSAKKLASAGLLGMALTIGPWAAYTAYHDIPFSGTKNDNVTLVAGFYPNLVYKNPQFYGYPYRDPEAPDINQDTKKALAQLWEWSKQEPGKYLSWFLVGKPLVLWQWKTIQGDGTVFIYPVEKSVFRDNGLFIGMAALYQFVYPLMLILMLIGAIVALYQRKDFLMLTATAIIVYFVLIHIAFFSLPRYSIPLRPLMLLLNGFALQFLLSATFRQKLLQWRQDGKRWIEKLNSTAKKTQAPE